MKNNQKFWLFIKELKRINTVNRNDFFLDVRDKILFIKIVCIISLLFAEYCITNAKL